MESNVRLRSARCRIWAEAASGRLFDGFERFNHVDLLHLARQHALKQLGEQIGDDAGDDDGLDRRRAGVEALSGSQVCMMISVSAMPGQMPSATPKKEMMEFSRIIRRRISF